MLSRLITHILYHIAGGLSTILSERYVKKFSHSFHIGGGRPGALCVRFVKIGRNLFHIKHDKKRSRSPALCGGIKCEWWKLLSPYHRQAFQTYPQTDHWCRLADPRRCWFFTLSKNEPAPKTVNSFTFTTQSGRGKFNDIPFGQIVATFIPCGGLPNLPLAVYTPRNKI